MIASITRSAWHNSPSAVVPLTSGASSTARFASGPFDLLVVGDFLEHGLHAAGERGSGGVGQRDGNARAARLRRRCPGP